MSFLASPGKFMQRAKRISLAQQFAKGKANVISWAFDDPAGDMGSVYIADTVTPANNFNSSASAAILAKFTGWSATSPMMTRGPTGLLKYAPHNLCLQSQTFDTTWSRVSIDAFGSGSVANAVTAPDGTLTADFIRPTAASAQHRLDLTPSTNAQPQYFSVYAKAGGYSFVSLRVGSSGQVFDLLSGVVGTAGTLSGTISPVGDGWYLCTIYAPAAAANDVLRINPEAISTVAGTFTGDGASGIYLWGAHLWYGEAHSRDYIAGGLVTTSTAKFSIPTTYDTSGNKLGFLSWEARTNAAWWSRDLTQSAHVKTNATAYKTARGTDNELNSASRLVATAANGNVIQTITAASAQRVSSAKVRQSKGSGTVKMSQGETTGSELAVTTFTNHDPTTVSASTLTATSISFTQNSTGSTVLDAPFTSTVGKLYAVTYTISANLSAAEIRTGADLGGTSVATLNATAGSYTSYFIATATTLYLMFRRNVSGSTYDVTGISIKECTSTTLSLNAATYSEVSGTELISNGALVDATGWTAGTGVSISGGDANFTSVASGQGLTQVAATAFETGKLYKVEWDLVSYTSGSNVGARVDGAGSYIKPADNTTPGRKTVYVLATATSTSFELKETGGGGTYEIDNISVKEVEPSQAWTEAETAAATITNPCVAIWCATSGDAIDVDHVQCEVGAKASPPIITAGAAVTRAASLLTIDTSLFNWSGSAGTSVLHFTSSIPVGATSYNVFTLGSSNFCYVTSSATYIHAFDGTTVLGGSTFPIAQNVKQKVAYAFGARGQNLTVNGAAVINAAFDGTFGNGTSLRIESASAGFIVSRFKIVRDEASDAELIAETA